MDLSKVECVDPCQQMLWMLSKIQLLENVDICFQNINGNYRVRYGCNVCLCNNISLTSYAFYPRSDGLDQKTNFLFRQRFIVVLLQLSYNTRQVGTYRQQVVLVALKMSVMFFPYIINTGQGTDLSQSKLVYFYPNMIRNVSIGSNKILEGGESARMIMLHISDCCNKVQCSVKILRKPFP